MPNPFGKSYYKKSRDIMPDDLSYHTLSFGAFEALCDSVLKFHQRPSSQVCYKYQKQQFLNDSLFLRYGIKYNEPLTPMEVLERKAACKTRRLEDAATFPVHQHEVPCSFYCANVFRHSSPLANLNAQRAKWGNPLLNILNKPEVPAPHSVPVENHDAIDIDSSGSDSSSSESNNSHASFGSNKCRNYSHNVDSSCSSDQRRNKDVRVGCCVCFDDLQEILCSDRHLMATFCGHIFCNSCLDVLVKTNPLCPICRKKVVKKYVHRIYL